MHDIIACQHCNQRLRVPTDQGALIVRCPSCSRRWDWEPQCIASDRERDQVYSDRLDDLLLSWEERFEQGDDVPADELCRDCPELILPLEARIRALKKVAWVKKP